jgi:hypothetical protein
MMDNSDALEGFSSGVGAAYNGIPIREVGELPSVSVWTVTWGKGTINLNPTRLQRITQRIRNTIARAKDGWAVFKGDKAALDWDDYNDGY